MWSKSKATYVVRNKLAISNQNNMRAYFLIMHIHQSILHFRFKEWCKFKLTNKRHEIISDQYMVDGLN